MESFKREKKMKIVDQTHKSYCDDHDEFDDDIFGQSFRLFNLSRIVFEKNRRIKKYSKQSVLARNRKCYHRVLAVLLVTAVLPLI